jgi:uncharacterized LabA/DUF88 family protein
MERVAVFVDAGYLFAQGSVALTGTKQSREYLALRIADVLAALEGIATQQTQLPLLRVYWYDAMRLGRPTSEQMALSDSANIKIRLGQVNAAGEQKGVDALIVTDMAKLARNRAMADAVLVSGDEDVRVGVLLAQQFGVRVHLIGIHPARANQSRSLQQEADTTVEWDASIVRRFLSYTPPITPSAAIIEAAASDLEVALEPVIVAIPPAALATLKTRFENDSSVPQDHDRTLLRVGRIHHGQSTLTSEERSELRRIFVRLVLAR